jgi:hypothetical protein
MAQMDDAAFARRLSLALVILGTLAAGVWTLLAATIAAWNEDSNCASQPDGCDDTSQLIGLARPVWIALFLVVAAFLFALRRQTRLCWLMVISSIAPLVLIPIPGADYVVNQILVVAWLSILVLTGVVVASVQRRSA